MAINNFYGDKETEFYKQLEAFRSQMIMVAARNQWTFYGGAYEANANADSATHAETNLILAVKQLILEQAIAPNSVVAAGISNGAICERCIETNTLKSYPPAPGVLRVDLFYPPDAIVTVLIAQP